MSINYSPRIVTDGLKLSLDSFNPRSTLYNKTQNSLINMSAWTASSGSVTGFNQNGSNVENVRYVTTNPYGNNSVIWEARADGTGESDGGWNTADVSINPSKMYRFTVWVKRTSTATSGTFYYGVGGGVIQTSDNNVQWNPYWHCANIGNLTQNLWYLVVAYVYPYNTTYTGKNALEGFYTIAGGATAKVADTNSCNIGTGVKWAASQTTTIQRTYLYYSSDAGSRLQFFDPRIDVVDGTEPSIGDLLKDPTTWHDTSGNGNNFTMSGSLTWSASQGYSDFSNAANRFYKSSFPLNYKFGQQGGNGLTAIIWAKSTGVGTWKKLLGNGDAENYIDLYQSPSGYYVDEASGTLAVNGSSVSNGAFYMNGAGWKMYSATYFNAGSLVNPSGALTIGSEPGGGSYEWTGNIASVMLYNKVLTSSEILQNFNATRTKFGV